MTVAHVIEVPEKAMDATHRCDRCGAQAYVEVLVPTPTGESVLLFCAHHWREHKDKFLTMPVKIADHTQKLEADESKSPASAK